jgi:hypothetical protein
MRRIILKERLVYVFVLTLLISLTLGGCAPTVKERREEPATRAGEIAGKYYHFDDIRVPQELNYNQKRSFIYETPHFKTGVLFFSKWRVDAGSLIDFFNYHMEKDNWKLVNSFKGKESILNFSKTDRTCSIKISETWWGNTEVEIRVGPLGEKKM